MRSFQPSAWPRLVTPGWEQTSLTLHLWTQIVGKTRLALAPMTNHWWQVPLYVTARGLGTSLIPHGARSFEVELDLLSSQLEIRTSDDHSRTLPLHGGKVSDFYRRYFEALRALGLDVAIHPLVAEIAEPIRLDRDATPHVYDPDWARALFGALVRVDEVFKEFRGAFLGKASPVHFFWGSFDLAATRFSGRRAPPHPGGAPHVNDAVMREAYSHEVISAGFWPGGAACLEPLFYAYAYPEPEGFATAPVLPEQAHYHPVLREFALPYETVRAAERPERALLMFLQSTYVAAAELADWPRDALERPRVQQPPEETGHELPL